MRVCRSVHTPEARQKFSTGGAFTKDAARRKAPRPAFRGKEAGTTNRERNDHRATMRPLRAAHLLAGSMSGVRAAGSRKPPSHHQKIARACARTRRRALLYLGPPRKHFVGRRGSSLLAPVRVTHSGVTTGVPFAHDRRLTRRRPWGAGRVQYVAPSGASTRMRICPSNRSSPPQ